MRSTWVWGALIGSISSGLGACGGTEISVGTPGVDAGADAAAVALDGGAAADASVQDASIVEACVPSADEPDDAFADTDCDGIDGSIAHAIFASPTAASNGTGTVVLPFSTLAAAITAARAQQKDVYACLGTYLEPGLDLDGSVRVFGGYDCDGSPTPARKAGETRLASTSPHAMTIVGAATTVLLDRVSVESAAGESRGEPSSIAIFARDARVEMRHGVVQAGLGAAGLDGPQIAVDPLLLPNGEAGEDVFTPTAQQLQTNTDFVVCNAFSTSPTCSKLAKGGGRRGANVEQACRVKGGAGGDGIRQPGDPVNAGATGEGAGGLGGTFESPAGAPGSGGTVGAAGAGGSRGFGLVSDSGYAVDDSGVAGTSGGAGGGGGGGAGGRAYQGVVRGGVTYTTELALGAGGGQGGCGGAGGVGGAAGSSGGASIGVLARRASLVFTDVRIVAQGGGAGGRGASGTSGLPGSSGGAGGHGSCQGCYAGRGGNGGAGGAGGAGGGGAGGPSIALVEDGAVTTLASCTLLSGAGGAGGTTGTATTRARDGRSAERITVGSDGRAP